LEISNTVKGQPATERDVDSYELYFARRALANLKALLHGQPMMDLLADQCADGDAYFKTLLAESNGRFEECVTSLSVRGLRAIDIQAARKAWLRSLSKDEFALAKLLPIHPEHYAAPDFGHAGEDSVVEVIGGHVVRLRIVTSGDVPDFVTAYGSYPMAKLGVCRLVDGTAVFYILHGFRDTEDGCDVKLVFPAAAPESMFREHAMHLAVQFWNGLKMVYEETGRNRPG
jgi:hypothetical protein